MSTDWRAGLGKFALAIALGSVTVPCWESMVSAQQIIPDDTLGAESSVVTPDNIKGIESDRISGGAVRGNNLFHSFREFNIGEGKGGYFENPAAIENIFSRVTGSNPSEILGTLGVLGNANLFFLNPNGIIFGHNASLDVRGSFIGTTADSIVFPDGKQFSATNPDVPPLLTVNVQQPIGLQFEGQKGLITNAADLAVASRQTLSLSGSDVATTGNLTAPGGRVEVLGTNSVALLEDATIDVSSPTGGGTVLIGGDFQGKGTVPNAQRTYVGDKVTINVDALINGNGGKVIVWADEVTGFYGSISARGGIESGHGGLVEVSGKEHLIFRGNVNTSAVNGLPGTLLLDPTNIIIADGSGDEGGDGTDSFAGNNSGVVGSILTAPLSEIDDTAPTTIYESELEGLSGDTNIVLQATNDIRLQDLSDDGLELAAGAGVIALSADADRDGIGDFVMEDNVADTIFTNGRDIAISGANLTIGSIDTSQQVGNSGSISLNAIGDISINGLVDTSVNLGDGGGVNITARSLLLTNAAQINSSINGEGNAGAIAITATESVNVSGESSQGSGSRISSQVNQGAKGTAGGITINTGSLSLRNGAQLSASTLGEGDARAIAITATDVISIEGRDSLGFPSGIFSVVAEGAEGKAGNITIDTGSLFLKDGIELNASTFGFGVGNAGDIAITATDVISLEGESSQGLGNGIFSLVLAGAEGKAGNITIDTGSLFLKDGGQLVTSTRGVGNAGDITITATDVISIEGRDSQGFRSSIFSAVFLGAEGKAGNITIDTGSLFLTDGGQLIAATRGVGNAGDIIIDTGSLFLTDGTRVIASTEGEGKAGNVIITANTLEATNGSQIQTNTTTNSNAADITLEISESLFLSGTDSGLFAQTEGAGKAGNIKINTPQLTIDQGASISAFTEARGNGGTITINAPQAVLLTDNSKLTVETSGAGRPGDITITTPNLTIGKDAEISATATETSTNKEKGGSITVNSANLDLTGKLGIFAETQGEAPAGTLNLQPDNNKPNLDIQFTDTAIISASTTGSGTGGDINLTAPETINITGQGKFAV